MDGYVTTNEVARRLNVKVETVRRWVRLGKLPGLPLGRAGYRISEEDFASFVQHHASPTQEPDVAMQSFIIPPFLPLLETITDSFIILDRQWRYRYLNDAACQILDCTITDLFDQVIWQAYPELVGSPLEIALQEAVASGHAVPCEYISAITGRWHHAQIYPATTWVSIYATDITEQKEKERRFQATFEQAAIGMAHVALDGHWLSVNQRLCDLVGYTREELLSSTFQEITYPDDLEKDLAFVRQLLVGEQKTYTLEKRYVCRDGSLLWINLMVSLVRDATGNPLYFISVVEDINERKCLELLHS